MTDWTTPEDVPADTVDRLHRWLLQEGNPADAATPGERAVADIIRTFWPVPPRTLAEGLEYRADLLDNGDPDGDTANVLRTLATDAIQMEHDLAEARAEVAEWKRRTDHARAEVERLTAERNRIATGRYVTYAEVDGNPVQKGAESNAETPDPADVKPGEAWLVGHAGAPGIGVRNCSNPDFPWTVVEDEGHDRVMDSGIVLRSRMVPAPRVITDPDELDRLRHNSVILSADNDAWQKSTRTILWSSPWWDASHGGPAMWPSERLCDEDHPVTVLWEPGV